jgi:pimeloyl-ACP methyl ester carboxylesterase
LKQHTAYKSGGNLIHRLPLRQVEIAYIDEGKGTETFVFVHGLGGYLWNWVKNVEILRGGFRCIALDLPGYGQSSKGHAPYSMAFFADVLQEFLEKMGLSAVNLVGHSMGGQIALTLAARGCPLLKRLILVAPAGFETFNGFEKELIKATYNPLLMRSHAREQVLFNYKMVFSGRIPDEAQFMIDDRMDLVKNPQQHDLYCQMIAQCVDAMLEEPVFHRLSDIHLPTLIIFGGFDYLIPNRFFHPTDTPLSIGQRGQSKMPNSELTLIAQAGHFVQFEQARRVCELMVQFVKGE